MKKLIPIFLFASAVASAQEMPKEGGPVVSARGDAIAREEFDHRMEMAGLNRQLEVVTIEGKIAKEVADKKKTESAPTEVNFAPLTPTSIRMMGNGQTMPVMPADSMPASAATVAPKVVGTVGESVYLRVGTSTSLHLIGDVVDGYRVKSVSGGIVTLQSTGDQKTEIVSRLP